jgi:imidazolonepropionase
MGRIFIKNIGGLVQVRENFQGVLKGTMMSDVPILHNAFLAIEDGIVLDYGLMSDWPGITDWRNLEVVDAEGGWVLPGMIDPHTHLVFAKTREEEFVDRIKGLTYEEIAIKGGGILNSAAKLNEMCEDELFEAAHNRLLKVVAHGTAAIEIKSGYGLSVEGELKMLRVIKRLKQISPIPIKATFLGAHAFPLAFKNDHAGYIRLLIEEILPIVAEENLAEYIDVFCERNYFSVEEMTLILKAGNQYGLKPKVHVNQFSILGGVKAAVELGAISVDHLEEINEDDIYALKKSECIPTFLPGCSHFLGIPFGDARKAIEAGLPVALASDYNPGSTPCYNLFQIWSLACIKMKMTPEEALNALTINAAAAIQMENDLGRIFRGYKGSIVLTKPIPSLAYLPYSFGEMNVERVFLV